MKDMQDSIQKIKSYDGSIKIYPGHGDESTLLNEFRENPYLK